MSSWVYLGQIMIQPVNQAGSWVFCDESKGELRLSRRSSVFQVFLKISTERLQIPAPHDTHDIRLVCGKHFVGFSESTGRVIAVPLSDSSGHKWVDFGHQRQIFGYVGSSFKVLGYPRKLWMRHSNSQLYVCDTVSCAPAILSSTQLMLVNHSTRMHPSY